MKTLLLTRKTQRIAQFVTFVEHDTTNGKQPLVLPAKLLIVTVLCGAHLIWILLMMYVAIPRHLHSARPFCWTRGRRNRVDPFFRFSVSTAGAVPFAAKTALVALVANVRT